MQQMLRVLAVVFRGSALLLRILLSGCFRARTDSVLATTAAVVHSPCCASSISGFCTAGTASTSSIWPVGSVRTASTRSTETLLMCPVYLEYGIYFDRLCTVSTITILRPIVRHRNTRRWTREWELERITWGQFEHFKHWRVLGNVLRRVCTASTLSISRLCTLKIFYTSSVSGFDATGSYLSVLSGFRPCFYSKNTPSSWVFSVLTRYWPSVLQFNALSTRTTNCFRASFTVSVKPFSYPERQETYIF